MVRNVLATAGLVGLLALGGFYLFKANAEGSGAENNKTQASDPNSTAPRPPNAAGEDRGLAQAGTDGRWAQEGVCQFLGRMVVFFAPRSCGCSTPAHYAYCPPRLACSLNQANACDSHHRLGSRRTNASIPVGPRRY